jgi:hypothetical protein
VKKIIDFVIEFDKALWSDFQSVLISTNDKLKDNYIGLDPRTFASFPVVVINDRIVCFSALQLNVERWGNGIGRVSTRMWIHPEYRHRGKFTGGDKFLNTTHCLPLQMIQAQLLGLDCVFISREGTPKAFNHFLDLVEINCSKRFLLESTQYNVCGSIEPIPESCKQWVAVLPLTENGMPAWNNNMKHHKLDQS